MVNDEDNLLKAECNQFCTLVCNTSVSFEKTGLNKSRQIRLECLHEAGAK